MLRVLWQTLDSNRYTIMMKNLILVFIIILAVVLFGLYTDSSAPSHTTKQSTKVQLIDDQLEESAQVVSDLNILHNTSDITKEDNYPVGQSYSLFEELDIESVMETITPIKNVTPVAALRMKKNSIKEIEVEDTIVLPSIDGTIYELKITNKEVSSRGNVSIDGSFSENGIEYSAILTEGSSAAFISMNTPEGTYEVTLLNGLGFVYATNDIDKAKIDYTKSDEINLPQHHHKEE